MELNEPRPELTVPNEHTPIIRSRLASSVVGPPPVDAQEHLDDLEYYSNEYKLTSTFGYAWKFVKLLPACLGFGSNFLYVNLMTTTGLHFAAQESKDPGALDLSEFSIAIFLCSITLVSITNTIIEKATIDTALHFANYHLEAVRKVVYEGFFALVLINLCVFLPGVASSPYWLGALNYNAESGVRIQGHLYKLFWTLTVGQSVLYAMAITGTIVPNSQIPALSILNAVTAAGTVYFFCWYKSLGLQGWFLAYFTHQAFRVMIYIPYCVSKLKDVKLFRKASELWSCRPWEYLWVSKLFLLGSYTEQIATEISTYLTVLTWDHRQVAAQTAFINMTYFPYNVGLGFALVGRSRYGYLHERATSIKTPLRFFCNFFIGLVVLSALSGYVQFRLTTTFLDMFAGSNPSVRNHLASLIKLYSFTLVLDLALNFVFSLLRYINKLEVATVVNFALIIVLQSVTGLILVLGFKKDVVWVMANYYWVQGMSVGLGTIVLLRYKRPQDTSSEKGHYIALN